MSDRTAAASPDRTGSGTISKQPLSPESPGSSLPSVNGTISGAGVDVFSSVDGTDAGGDVFSSVDGAGAGGDAFSSVDGAGAGVEALPSVCGACS